ncbi:hypothetical protein [Neisseria gonorrhoeae]|uniref:hypothetical protein n=1 Tax=Neisseria gonorrhoeae TaxID=485 RepID=UPI001BFEA04D|nr:hypothetical protein [Neisseria gonorrhoeae]MBT8034768.1 hypothetical protein [Neisseria gonorrhoeae]
MNKTLKRRVFRHTALYTAILMFSHTGGGGGAGEARDSAFITVFYTPLTLPTTLPVVLRFVLIMLKKKQR